MVDPMSVRPPAAPDADVEELSRPSSGAIFDQLCGAACHNNKQNISKLHVQTIHLELTWIISHIPMFYTTVPDYNYVKHT